MSNEIQKFLERGLQHNAYSQSVATKLANLAKAREAITAMQDVEKERLDAITEVSYELQNATLDLAAVLLSNLKPHTLPVNLDMVSDDAGKPGIELAANGQIYVIFINGSRPLNAHCIQEDPAVLHQFRERLPAFLESYARKHDQALLELVKELVCIITSAADTLTTVFLEP